MPILMKNNHITVVKIDLCEACANEVSKRYFEIAREHGNCCIHGEALGGYSASDAKYTEDN